MCEFKIGDDVIFFDNDDHDYDNILIVGQAYKITRVYSGKITKIQHITVETQLIYPKYTSGFSSRFLSKKDYNIKQRAQKLNKLTSNEQVQKI